MRVVILIHLAVIYVGGAGAIEHARAEEFVSVCDRSSAVKTRLEGAFKVPCDQIGPDMLAWEPQFRLTFSIVDQPLKCGDFTGFKYLTDLTLQGNSKPLPKCVFDGLDNLRELNVVFGWVTSLPDDIFLSLGRLEHLSFRGNQISSLTRSHFRSLKNLKVLDFWSNRLFRLPEDLLADLPQLEGLSFEDNSLVTVPANLFVHSPNLKQVFLAGNPMTEIPEGLFFPLHNLTIVTLGSGHLQYIPDFTFAHQARLQTLRLMGNSPLKLTGKAAFYGLGPRVVMGLPPEFDADSAGEEWRGE